MKKQIVKFMSITAVVIIGSNQGKAQGFKAEQYVKSASIILNGSIDKVFPLFGAIEEKKWAEGWNPIPVFPESGDMQEGFIFQTADHAHEGAIVTWVVAAYEVKDHVVKYIITAPDRLLFIDVYCSEQSANSTKAEVTYKFTGLTAEGNEISHHLLARIFENNLKDWETAINNYLSKSN